MKCWSRLALLVLLFASLPAGAHAQKVATDPQRAGRESTVLFVCEHGTVRSLLAKMVVSFDGSAAATPGAPVPRAHWDSLPSVSKNYAAGRDAIKSRVHQLVDSLVRARGTTRR